MSETFQGHMSDVDVWCQEGHSPKLARKRDPASGQYVCSECGRIYLVTLNVEDTGRYTTETDR